MNKSVDNIFLSTNAVKAHSRTHNARHSSAEKSEGIIAPMVPYKGRICTSPLRQDRPERDHPCASPPSCRRDGPYDGRMQVFTSRTPERRTRTAVTPSRPGPSRANSYLRACRKCVPPRRQTGKRISESIKVADSIIRRAQPRWHQPLVIGVDHLRIEYSLLWLVENLS